MLKNQKNQSSYKKTKGKGYLPRKKISWHMAWVGPLMLKANFQKKKADEALFGEAAANTVLELAYSIRKFMP